MESVFRIAQLAFNEGVHPAKRYRERLSDTMPDPSEHPGESSPDLVDDAMKTALDSREVSHYDKLYYSYGSRAYSSLLKSSTAQKALKKWYGGGRDVTGRRVKHLRDTDIAGVIITHDSDTGEEHERYFVDMSGNLYQWTYPMGESWLA